ARLRVSGGTENDPVLASAPKEAVSTILWPGYVYYGPRADWRPGSADSRTVRDRNGQFAAWPRGEARTRRPARRRLDSIWRTDRECAHHGSGATAATAARGLSLSSCDASLGSPASGGSTLGIVWPGDLW